MNTAITSFPFPEDIALLPIGQSAFANTRFTSLNIPACGVINVGAFAGCAVLEEVTLPESLTLMNIGAFSDCPELRSITINGSNIGVSGTLSGCPEDLVIYVPSECNYADNAGWGTYTVTTIPQ